MKNTKRNLLACAILFFTCACVCTYAARVNDMQAAGPEMSGSGVVADSETQTDRHEMGDSLTVFFRQGLSDFDPDFRQNGKRCEEFIRRIENLKESDVRVVAKVEMYSSASPEGSVALNERLAKDRAKSVLEYLHEVLDFDDSIVFIQAITEDWDGLAALAEADPKVPSKAKARVIVDFAHTPDGLQKVLEASRAFTRGRLWVVFGAGGDRDRAKRPLMGEAAAKTADCLVVTSDNPRSEDPLAIIDEIMVGVRRAVSDTSRVAVEPDRAKAISYALSNAEADDVVLVCGKGHETTQEIKGVKYPFDDREIVRNYAKIHSCQI